MENAALQKYASNVRERSRSCEIIDPVKDLEDTFHVLTKEHMKLLYPTQNIKYVIVKF
jgi:hypothetical protein